jgi:hypothetical protein
MKVLNKVKLSGGVSLTLFNICVFIFTQNNIDPEYFEWLFAIYFLISFWLGSEWICESISLVKEGEQ